MTITPGVAIEQARIPTCLSKDGKTYIDILYDSDQELEYIPRYKIKTSPTLPFLPNNAEYQATDLYARIYADSIDVDLILTTREGHQDVFAEAVTTLPHNVVLRRGSAIYCGTKLGNGILGEIKVIRGRWTAVEVMFWSILRSREIDPGVDECLATVHDIMFPTHNLEIPDVVHHTEESQKESRLTVVD